MGDHCRSGGARLSILKTDLPVALGNDRVLQRQLVVEEFRVWRPSNPTMPQQAGNHYYRELRKQNAGTGRRTTCSLDKNGIAYRGGRRDFHEPLRFR